MNDFVTIEHAPNQAIADMVKQRLDDAGIPSLIAPTGAGAVTGASATFAVSVAADRADEARELLSDS